MNRQDWIKDIDLDEITKKQQDKIDCVELIFDFTVSIEDITITFKNVDLEMFRSEVFTKEYICRTLVLFHWYNVGVYDKVDYEGYNFLITGITKKKITLMRLFD